MGAPMTMKTPRWVGELDLVQIEAGKVIEQGKHSELLKKSGGKYANLVQQQLAVEDKKEDTSTDPKADFLSAKMEGLWALWQRRVEFKFKVSEQVFNC